ncbi:MAG: outer membrane protein assembly factor BamA [Nitrospirae bacterium]|nr:outer membrane protein assembly factor BamA [Nitrospirota bacterium]
MNLTRTRLSIFIILLSAAFFIKASPEAFAIDDIPGNKIIKEIAIVSQAGESYEKLKEGLSKLPGSRFSVKVIREAMELLYQSGKFSNITVQSAETPEGLLITFTVYEKLKTEKVQWTGNKSFSTQRLAESIKLKEDMELLPGTPDDIEKHLTAFYQQEGYFKARITVSSRPMATPDRILLSIAIDEGDQSTIGSIAFSGDTGIDPATLLESLRIHPGFYYSKETVQNYIIELLPLYFRSHFLNVKIKEAVVHPGPSDRVDIEIPVEAGPKIFTRFSFKGPRHYLTFTLRNQILIETEKSIAESTLEESKNRLVEFYQNEGYPLVEVGVKTESASQGKTVSAIFEIAEGPKVLLTDLSFKGNASLPEPLLLQTVSQKKTGLWIPQYLRLPEIPNDLQSLTNLYHASGFLFAQIEEAIRYSENKKRASLEFKISEGIRSSIRSVTFEGISPSYLSEIEKLAKTREKNYYNIQTVLEDKLAISAFYHKRGHADMRIEATATPDETKEKVDINFEVEEGSIIKIGNIRVTGNDITHPRIVLRELYFNPGSLYQEELILKSQRKISQLGFFQSVNIRSGNPEEEGEEPIRDIEIRVKERNAGAFEFGAGYGDYERSQGFAELSHKNIAGTGRKASIRAEISEITSRDIVSYTEPWIFDLPLDANASVLYETTRKVTANYSQRTLSTSIGVEKTFSNYYKISLLYQNENVHYIDVPLNQQLIPEDRDRVNISSLNPSIIRDSRDNFLNPRKGSFNAAWFRWAAKFMGSEIQEVKLSLQSSWFYLFGRHLVMGISSRGGVAYNFGETPDVPLIERFKLGGRNTVRGYSEDTLGTIGQTLNPDLTPIGGNAMMAFNLEFRYDLPNSLGLVLFLDSGNVWRYNQSIWSSPLKSSAGPGLRYNTPVGPVRFDLGYKLNRETGETDSEFHFALGHAF